MHLHIKGNAYDAQKKTLVEQAHDRLRNEAFSWSLQAKYGLPTGGNTMKIVVLDGYAENPGKGMHPMAHSPRPPVRTVFEDAWERLFDDGL